MSDLKSRVAANRPSAGEERRDGVPATSKNTRRESLAPLRALGPYLARHPTMLGLAGLALVVSALAMLAVPMAVRHMIDFGFAAGDGRSINRYFALLIAIGAILAVASASRFYLVNWLGERVVADLRADVFRHLTTLGAHFYEGTHSGELLSRLTADTTQIKGAAGTAISQAVRNMIMLIGALTMMMLTSASLSALVLVAIPAIVLPLMAYGRVVSRLSRRAQDTLGEASAFAGENLAAIRTMQAFGFEPTAVARFTRAVEAAFTAARDRLGARAALTAVTIFLVVASVVGVLWYGAGLVVAGDMTGGRLGQFVLYALFAGGALAELSEVWGEVNQAAGAAGRLADILAIAPEIVTPASPRALPEPARGAIALRDVTFAYPSRPETQALSAVSIAVKPGERIAVVGPSGAGKTTLFNLILRFYDTSSGEVSIDGIDVRLADLRQLRGRMALVPQDPALFADTISANISYGTPDADADAIERAAKAAQAHGFITALPEGYATQLGERGVALSGGQRQRIAIARAILRDAPILLLDAESEALVQRALETVMEGRTTIVVAHRLATVQKADRILVMDGGRIVEEGRHGDLVARGGLYARLAHLQFGATPVDTKPADTMPAHQPVPTQQA